jgi:hypothetical protein
MDPFFVGSAALFSVFNKISAKLATIKKSSPSHFKSKLLGMKNENLNLFRGIQKMKDRRFSKLFIS